MKKRIVYALLAAAGFGALFFYYLFLVSHGDFRIVADEFTGMTYANMWSHLLHGRFDIDPSVNPELFYRDGKYYVYYSFFSVLLRGLLTPFYDASVSIPRLTLLIGALVLAVANLLMGLQLKLHEGKIRPFFFVFAALLLLGSPYMYIMTPAHCYHEAIMWGVANLTVFNLLYIRFAMAPGTHTLRRLCIMGMIAGFAMLSRPNVGFPTFLTLGATGLVLFWKFLKNSAAGYLAKVPRLKFKYLALIAGTWIFFGSCYLFVNYERMGSPFAVTPVIWHWQFSNPPGVLNPRGYTYYKYGEWRLDRFPVTFEYYLVPHEDNFWNEWPYLKMGYTLHTRPFARHFDYIEPGTYMPVTMTAPLILLLAVFGIYYLLRRWKKKNPTLRVLLGILLAANLWIWFFDFGFPCLNLRYSVDLMPPVVLGAYLGLYALKPMVEKWSLRGRRLALGGFILMALLSFWGVTSTYISYTTTNPHIPLDQRKEFFFKYVAPIARRLPL